MVVKIPSSALPHFALLLRRGKEAGSTEGRYSHGGVFHKFFPQFLSSWGAFWVKFRGWRNQWTFMEDYVPVKSTAPQHSLMS